MGIVIRVLRTATSVIGELLVTLGCVVLLFAAYELWGTSWATARAQDQLSGALDGEWAKPQPKPSGGAKADVAPPVGKPFLRIYIPVFGPGWKRTVLEGVGENVLSLGPGHYPDTALPGAVGNIALAGHRVGNGAPFDDANELRSCAAVVLETREAWFVYRVLPSQQERADWAGSAARRPTCRAVPVLQGAYAQTAGSEVVSPQQVDVIAPVPHQPGAVPTAALLTLTTCTPRFTARQRLIVHAVLTTSYAKADHRDPAWRPTELTQG